ncbi:retinoblastoma-related protein 2-like isoform X2 [Lolium rigidum]|uniref:retinoblastoma-related protein 2-like isoform X2 n=1 Tax=Lolium rigidum TaxID=89674 RepID=UPI001F5DDA28|nr:retinoblastoma-related protein 2-like isoform X2 [Lolium rigidum]
MAVPPLALDTRLADLCQELGVDKGVASEAAALLEEGKDALLTPSSFGSKSPQDVERLCFAFVLYCAARLKGMKEESSRVRLWKILEGCNLNYDDFFKESQQFRSKIDQILRSRYGSDWEDQLELKQLQSLVNLLADASRFYRTAFTELFSSASTSKEPGSTTNSPEYFYFGWQLFLALRSKSSELFKDLVSCIHGLVAILAILLIHMPPRFRSFTIEGSSHLIKQTVRGVDLLASLCHNYHTSEDRLKEMMGKSHKAIEEFFSKKAVWASECKTETLDKIDTDGLMYFKDLLDKECFQSNLAKLEKLSTTTSWEGELDLKMFLFNNDNIVSAKNVSGGPINTSYPKRVFETLASPTKTIKNMLTVPSSPASPINGGSVKIMQMTPVTSAMTTAKWFREVISSLPEKPSSKLEQFLLSCDTDLTSDITKRVSIVLEAIFPTKSSGDWGGSIGLNCTNAFDIAWAEARKLEASKLYYRVLEAICTSESLNTNVNNLTPLLSNERFHRCLIACSAELVLATHKTVIMMFPAVLENTGLTAFDLGKIIENFVRHEESLPRELKRHLNSLEEQLLESMVWEKGSSLYNSLVVARPSLAMEINRLGLLAEPMPSLDDIVTHQNIHPVDLPTTPSKKRAAGPDVDDNGDAKSPKRLCNESRNTSVNQNLQTPPPKQNQMLKAKWHPLQSAFASPTVNNPVGGNQKCAELGVNIFFSKVSQLTLTFKEIVSNYKREQQCKPEVFRRVFVGSTNRNGALGSRHVDIIVFYNEVFVPAVKPFLVALIPSVACPDDKKSPNSQIPGSPKPSPFSNLPDMSPKKVSSSHNVYVSPLRQTKKDALLSPSSRSFYACIGESTHAYQSPSTDLAAINNRLNYTSRRINTRINFDVVSDSVVAGTLGQPNGGPASPDPAAAFSPLPKKGKPGPES